jgi:hypothetical protein
VTLQSAPLIAALDDEDWFVRRSAGRALGEVGDGSAIEPLIEQRADGRSEVRRAAARALAKLGEPRWSAYVDGGQGDFERLATCDDRRAIWPMKRGLTRGDWLTRRSAAQAPGTIGGPGAAETLIRALGDEHSEVRKAAAGALGQLRDWCALTHLLDLLRDTHGEVRKAAVGALGRLAQTRSALAELASPAPSRSGSVHPAIGTLGIGNRCALSAERRRTPGAARHALPPQCTKRARRGPSKHSVIPCAAQRAPRQSDHSSGSLRRAATTARFFAGHLTRRELPIVLRESTNQRGDPSSCVIIRRVSLVRRAAGRAPSLRRCLLLLLTARTRARRAHRKRARREEWKGVLSCSKCA